MEDYDLEGWLIESTGISPYAAHSGNFGFSVSDTQTGTLTYHLPADVPDGAVCTLQLWYMLQDSGNPGGCFGLWACYFSAAVGDTTFFDSSVNQTLLVGTGSGQGDPSTDYVLLQSPPFVYYSGPDLVIKGAHSFGFYAVDDITIQCSVTASEATPEATADSSDDGGLHLIVVPPESTPEATAEANPV